MLRILALVVPCGVALASCSPPFGTADAQTPGRAQVVGYAYREASNADVLILFQKPDGSLRHCRWKSAGPVGTPAGCVDLPSQ